MRKVVVTGMGCISALGSSVAETWANINDPRHGIGSASFSVSGGDVIPFVLPAGRVSVNPVNLLTSRFPRKVLASVDPFAQFGAVATVEALDDAGLAIGDPRLVGATILYGSASGGNAAVEAGYQRIFGSKLTAVHPLTVPRTMNSSGASHLSVLFGVQGLCLAISSACASSAHAVVEGMHMIRAGRADIVVAGGGDATLTYGGLIGWRSLQAVSEDGCRPFSRDRRGTVLGEGAATLVLEEEQAARRRGATVYAELLGAGCTSDAGHLTQPDAASAARAVREAHRDAGVPLDEPLLISTHGTGTALNDRTEAEMLREVYGNALKRSTVIATKSAHGHMLGATGAMELLLAIQALNRGEAPAIRGYLGVDPDCGDLPLALEPTSLTLNTALSTSLAFGGLNCALLVRRELKSNA